MSGNPEPFDFSDAREAINTAKTQQARAEVDRRDAAKNLAEAERAYRVLLAKTILSVHADGAAWTVAQDLARGDKKVADLRYERDVAKGVLDVAEQSAWRHAADRKDLARLVDWSMKVAPNGGQVDPETGLRVAA